MGIILALNEQTQVVSHNCILLISTTFSGWGMLLAGLGNNKKMQQTSFGQCLKTLSDAFCSLIGDVISGNAASFLSLSVVCHHRTPRICC